MANLTGVAAFVSYLRQLETTDPRHPDTWNPNYQLLINNDVYLKQRVEAAVAEIEGLSETMGEDFQNALVANLTLAQSNAGLALREIEKTLHQRFQSGRVTVQNRGIITGCVVGKSATAARNLDVSAGRIFQGGRIIPVAGQVNAASVPPNTTAAAAVCWAYLMDDGTGVFDLRTTLLGEDVPADAVVLSKITVPVGNNESTDQYLADCILSDQRRVEAGFPATLSSSPTVFIELPYPLADNDYQVDFEVIGLEGSGFQLGYCYVGSRAANGFTLYYNGAADALDVRWTARKLDQ
jgi:hypothetical protein